MHIPFCRSRCAYCDFAAEPLRAHLRAGRVERYVEALREELAERAEPVSRPFETVYVGGGTPTVLPAQLLLPLVADLKRLQVGAVAPEFTIEANPGTIDFPLLEALAAAGVTRLSLGVQSFSPALRAALGRRVAQTEIDSALAAIAQVGWRDWNLDLVFAIPGQDWAAAAADLDAAVAAGPAHVSLYDLTYTRGYAARVARRGGAGARRAAGAFAEEHLAAAVARLEAAGYRRYEVSNFALPGYECRHNQAYWRGEDYLGIGAAAVTTAGGLRSTNPRSLAAYLGGEPPEIESVPPEVRLWERAMLGLRTAEGVDEDELAPVLLPGAVERLLAQGCIERRCGRLRLHPGYLNVSNTVISSLLVTLR